ncbi:MAG: hypothetical protein ACI4QW_05450 [Clostridia bacterium]
MKMKMLRFGVLCMMLAMLCAGAVFQYRTADQNQRTNAVLVMAHCTR